MRISFPDIDCPKRAAKHLSRLSPDVTLSAAHEAIARASGYRDWHELSLTSSLPASHAEERVGPGWAREIILAIADKLGLLDGDVQFVLTRARFFGAAWSLADQIAVKTSIWRERLFGPPGRGRPGTVIKVKVSGCPIRQAYLRASDRPSRVLYDSGVGHVADFEVITPRQPLPDFLPARLWLPYGFWVLSDGSRVVFARDYFPLWRLSADGVERLEPWYWINGISETLHFGASTWASGAGRDLALAYLAQHRITALPPLVDIMPYLLEKEIDSMRDAVAQFRADRRASAVMPSYVSENPYLPPPLARGGSGRVRAPRPPRPPVTAPG